MRVVERNIIPIHPSVCQTYAPTRPLPSKTLHFSPMLDKNPIRHIIIVKEMCQNSEYGTIPKHQ